MLCTLCSRLVLRNRPLTTENEQLVVQCMLIVLPHHAYSPLLCQVAVMGDSKFECSSCTFDHNEAHGAGGALAVLGGTAELDDAKFNQNFAVSYGPLPHISLVWIMNRKMGLRGSWCSGGAVFGDVPARIALTGPMNGEEWLRGNMITPGATFA